MYIEYQLKQADHATETLCHGQYFYVDERVVLTVGGPQALPVQLAVHNATFFTARDLPVDAAYYRCDDGKYHAVNTEVLYLEDKKCKNLKIYNGDDNGKQLLRTFKLDFEDVYYVNYEYTEGDTSIGVPVNPGFQCEKFSENLFWRAYEIYKCDKDGGCDSIEGIGIGLGIAMGVLGIGMAL